MSSQHGLLTLKQKWSLEMPKAAGATGAEKLMRTCE